MVSVAIQAPPERLYFFLTDIENLSDFFPGMEFRRETEGRLKAGDRYHTRRKGAKGWTAYRVLALEPNARMSAELAGRDWLFQALRYDHRFLPDGEQTISQERVDYTLRYGFFGRLLNRVIGRRLIGKQVLEAHLRLKEKAE